MSTQGVTDPLTADNALYSIQRIVTRKVTSQDGNLIRSNKIPHKLLRMTPTSMSAPSDIIPVTLFPYLSVMLAVNCVYVSTAQWPTSVETLRINYLGPTSLLDNLHQ
jgi:hypothetical protein